MAANRANFGYEYSGFLVAGTALPYYFSGISGIPVIPTFRRISRIFATSELGHLDGRLRASGVRLEELQIAADQALFPGAGSQLFDMSGILGIPVISKFRQIPRSFVTPGLAPRNGSPGWVCGAPECRIWGFAITV